MSSSREFDVGLFRPSKLFQHSDKTGFGVNPNETLSRKAVKYAIENQELVKSRHSPEGRNHPCSTVIRISSRLCVVA